MMNSRHRTNLSVASTLAMASIPVHDINGVIPPFLGANPGGPSSEMSPYKVDLIEIMDRFGTSVERIAILEGFLNYRAALRAAGITSGFQWLDGSFVENIEARLKRPPADIDMVTFVSELESNTLNSLMRARHPAVDRNAVKTTYKCDSFFVALKSAPHSIVLLTRYWFGLFSHQRDTRIWKGMLEVPLDTPNGDLDARQILTSRSAAVAGSGVGGAP